MGAATRRTGVARFSRPARSPSIGAGQRGEGPVIVRDTREKLVTYRPETMRGGRALLTDRELILRFARLERALRAEDLAAAQRRVGEIETALTARGLRHLVYFAYWYAKWAWTDPQTRGQVAIRAWAADALAGFGQNYRSALAARSG